MAEQECKTCSSADIAELKSQAGNIPEDKKCTVEYCDMFDFMANHICLTYIHPGGLAATRELIDSCQINKDSKVLDIGCGKGTTSIYLAQKYGCGVVGIDFDEDLVSQSIALVKRTGLEDLVNFRVADATAMPFSDSEFDVAIEQAVFLLIEDKKKAIQEALRVIKPNGYIGCLELSWKKPPTREFLEGVSNVICAYCMLGVETFEDWEALFKDAGVRDLIVKSYSMEFQGMRGMIADEGWINIIKIMFKYIFKRRIRGRMKTMNQFFADNSEYFGHGIYIGRK